jgi:hypothetical protein
VDTVGWTLILASWALFVATALWLRTRAPALLVDGLLAMAGVGVAVGGLLELSDVGIGSWIVAPAFLGIGAVVHVRALFTGSGPFRT